MSTDPDRENRSEIDRLSEALARIRDLGEAGDPEVVEAVLMVEQRLMSTGPLPAPSIMAEYEQAVPGLGQVLVDRMLIQHDQEIAVENRIHDRADRELEHEAVTVRRGMWMMFVIVLGFLAVAAVGLFVDKPPAVYVGVGAPTLFGVVWAVSRLFTLFRRS